MCKLCNGMNLTGCTKHPCNVHGNDQAFVRSCFYFLVYGTADLDFQDLRKKSKVGFVFSGPRKQFNVSNLTSQRPIVTLKRVLRTS
jgi:hypothetical protein